MDESSASDCIVLDTTVPTIELDESVAHVNEEGETTMDSRCDETAEDGELAMQDEENYTKKELMHILFASDAEMQRLGPELIEFMHQKCQSLAVDLDKERMEIKFFEKVLSLDESVGPSEAPLFTIDSTPSKGRQESSDIPRYTKSSSEALSNDVREEKQERAGKGRNSCFNCDGDHNLRDCTEPRNQQRINANRKGRQGKAERYHVDLSQKYGHLKPGQISKRLRKALGLKSKDLPVHIFRMRRLGYPPGWLADAKISHSGINLFGSDGSAIKGSDDEDGEMDVVRDKYNPEKIIDYPGFNVDPPEGAYDDARLFDCPPMQEDDRKEVLLERIGANVATAYKRRKMNSFPMNESQTDVSAADMDVADDEEEGQIADDPPLPVEFATPAAPPPPPAETAAATEAEGEEKTTEEKDTSTTVDDSLVDFIMTRDANESVTEEDKTTTPAKRNSVQLLSSKEVYEGTPLLKSASEFDKLPSGDKWAVGVSDVINFENLPDSVGKYEKMKVLIKKVQTAVKQIQSE